MEIQVGKEYMTRDGRKVVIYATDKGGKYPVHGSRLTEDGTWEIQSWRLDGIYLIANVDDKDIVSEWEEPLDFDWDCLPKWADRFIAMDKNGDWFCSNFKPVILESDFWVSHDDDFEYKDEDLVSIEIPTSHAPKNYTGNWKYSLQDNPKYKQ